jgi:uncharacterized protein (DUF362 family)
MRAQQNPIPDLAKVLSSPLGRRDFMRLNGRGALWLAALGCGLRLPRPARAASSPHLVVVTGQRNAATRAAVDLLGGMGRFVKPGQRVVVKPNMSFAHGAEEAANTHPEVVREVVAMCRQAGAARVRVLDHPLRQAELCIEGVRQACGIFEEDMVHGLSQPRFFKPAPIPAGVQMKETQVMQEVLAADVLIAVPVAKSHGSTGVSLTMKGMMGLVWDRGSMHGRYDLHTAIVDLASLLRPALVIIDGSRVLSTNGPSGPGTVLTPNTIIASTDMVSADAQAVREFEWYGRRLEPRQVDHIRLAHERGLGRMDLERLAVRRERV